MCFLIATYAEVYQMSCSDSRIPYFGRRSRTALLYQCHVVRVSTSFTSSPDSDRCQTLLSVESDYLVFHQPQHFGSRSLLRDILYSPCKGNVALAHLHTCPCLAGSLFPKDDNDVFLCVSNEFRFSNQRTHLLRAAAYSPYTITAPLQYWS